MNIKDKLCEIGLEIAAVLTVVAFILIPLTLTIGMVKLILHWLGVI